VVAIGLFHGRPLTEMAIVGVSLAVAAVPESLPAVVAILAGPRAHRMARRKAVVRRLPAVETLGSVTVIATDKTGTITEGRMVAERIWTPAGEYVADAFGYDPTRGQIHRSESGHPVTADPVADEPALRRLLRDVALCNDGRLVREGEQWSVIGDPLEGRSSPWRPRADRSPSSSKPTGSGRPRSRSTPRRGEWSRLTAMSAE
jgi:Ca2+-transporting ATPase